MDLRNRPAVFAGHFPNDRICGDRHVPQMFWYLGDYLMPIPIPGPQIPTDNLYKFLALTGLVIAVLSAAFEWQSYEEQVSPTTNFRRDFALAKDEFSEIVWR